MAAIPKSPGWWFAKWRIADDGTREGDELTPSDRVECVEVFENCNDPDSTKYLRVSVSGVAESQSIENFFWIGPVPMPVKS
jgi:hypothetical protein